MRKGLATSQRQWEQQICHDKKSCLRSRCRRAICLNSRKICSILMFFFFARSYFVFCSNFQKVWTNSWGLRSLRHAWLRSHMETWRRRQIISVTPSNLWWSPWERPGIGVSWTLQWQSTRQSASNAVRMSNKYVLVLAIISTYGPYGSIWSINLQYGCLDSMPGYGKGESQPSCLESAQCFLSTIY